MLKIPSPMPSGCAPSGCELEGKHVNVKDVEPELITFASTLGLAVLHLTGSPLCIYQGHTKAAMQCAHHTTGRAIDFVLRNRSGIEQLVIAQMSAYLAYRMRVVTNTIATPMNEIVVHVQLWSAESEKRP